MMPTLDLPLALAPFADPLAFAIVAGGTLLALCLRTTARDLARAFAALGVIARRRFDAAPVLDRIAALDRIARRHGVVSLGRSVIADADVAAAISAIVDGAGAADIAALVAQRRQARTERHLAAIEVWTSAAELAPAMGMIGTLVGLVGMFVTMRDPDSIGASMAVALLATLYGALLANLVAAPVAARLRRAARIEAFERARLDAPLVALAERESPRGAVLAHAA